MTERRTMWDFATVAVREQSPRWVGRWPPEVPTALAPTDLVWPPRGGAKPRQRLLWQRRVDDL